MSSELERNEGISGRVFTNGMAQEITRDTEGNVTGVRLTFMPGAGPPASGVIPLPEPLTMEREGVMTVIIEGLPGDLPPAESSFFMRPDTTVTTVYTPIQATGQTALPPGGAWVQMT